MKSKYYTMLNRQPQFFTSKAEAARVDANYKPIPPGRTAYHIEHHYPDQTTISFHLDTWERLGRIIKEIA